MVGSRKICLVGFVVAVLLLLIGCEQEKEREIIIPLAPEAEAELIGYDAVITNSYGGQTFLKLEYALTESERERGLKFRGNLCDNCGMFYAFDELKQLGVKMESMLIPIDAIFLDSNYVVNGIISADPCVGPCQLIENPEKAKYVLEANKGFAAKNKVFRGSRLEFVTNRQVLFQGNYPREYPIARAHNCTDSDGGINRNAPGNTSWTITYSGTVQSRRDFCVLRRQDGAVSGEFFCRSDMPYLSEIICPYGCNHTVFGCNTAPSPQTQQQNTCTDSDSGGFTTTKGTVTYYDSLTGNTITREDSCINTTYVTEYICYNNQMQTLVRECPPVNTYCDNGRCGLPPRSAACIDSDGGKITNIYGEVISSNSSRYHGDYCANLSAVMEFSCTDSIVASEIIKCPVNQPVCNGGRCRGIC